MLMRCFFYRLRVFSCQTSGYFRLILEDVVNLLLFVTLFLVTIQDFNITFDAPALNHLYNFMDDYSRPNRNV